jgi:hypothetical protein
VTWALVPERDGTRVRREQVRFRPDNRAAARRARATAGDGCSPAWSAALATLSLGNPQRQGMWCRDLVSGQSRRGDQRASLQCGSRSDAAP